MYQAPYFRSDGSAGAEVTLPRSLFDGVVHEGALHEAVSAYLGNQRQGTASKRNRAAVAGGSRKPWRQKGTGRARQGTTRAGAVEGWRQGLSTPGHAPGRGGCPKRLLALARASAFKQPGGRGAGWPSSRVSTSISPGHAS